MLILTDTISSTFSTVSHSVLLSLTLSGEWSEGYALHATLKIGEKAAKSKSCGLVTHLKFDVLVVKVDSLQLR